MKELEAFELEVLSLEESSSIDGGFPWGMFWSGAKVGLAAGTAVGVAYYFMEA